MRAICIARHRFLSEHYCAVFAPLGIAADPVVGFEEGVHAAQERRPDLVLCDYDLLVAAPLARWESDPVLGAIPIIAVSLTRRPEEAHMVDANGIAGFLYLPSLGEESAARVLHAVTNAAVRPPADAMRWRPERVEAPRLD